MRTFAIFILTMLIVLLAVPALAATAVFDGTTAGIMAKLIPPSSVTFKQGPGIQDASTTGDCKSLVPEGKVFESIFYTTTKRSANTAFSGTAPAFAAVSYQGRDIRHFWRML